MALFHPGQMLVYGNVGVCQVEAVGTPKFLRGESREYYTLTPVYRKHKEKIYLPTGTAAYLRPPVTPQPIWPRCPRWKCVHPATPSRPCWHSIIRSCCNPTVCRIICGCSRKSAARSGSEKTAAKS